MPKRDFDEFKRRFFFISKLFVTFFFSFWKEKKKVTKKEKKPGRSLRSLILRGFGMLCSVGGVFCLLFCNHVSYWVLLFFIGHLKTSRGDCVDFSTIEYYNKNYESIIALYQSNPDRPLFLDHFNFSEDKSEKILDVGFGSGRDFLYLAKEGYTVYGLDGSEKFVEHFKSQNPQYAENVVQCMLPSRENPFPVKFDLLICSAVLMHLHDDDLIETLRSFPQWLNQKSQIYISIPKKRSDTNENFRDQHGRYFNPISDQIVTQTLHDSNYICKEVYSTGDSLSRNGIEWWNLLYERS
jgi:SAM-dependent methyltransferase